MEGRPKFNSEWDILGRTREGRLELVRWGMRARRMDGLPLRIDGVGEEWETLVSSWLAAVVGHS